MKDLIKQLINAGIEQSEAQKEISILEKEFSDENKVNKIVNQRIKTRKPLQYILGKAYFMDFEVKVTNKVLIPRPETEILVEETVKRYRGTPWHVLDIGTGSGIIAIALAKLIPDIKIIAIDIDKDVINLARENAKRNSVENRIQFKLCDLFSDTAEQIFRTNNFNLIISNPPYVKEDEFKKLRPEVSIHEPKVALSGTKENKTGLIYYERIIELCCKGRSRPVPAVIALEIDPQLVKDLKSLLHKKGLNNFEIVKDYAKLDRCLFVWL